MRPFLLLLVLLLTGCASLPERPPVADISAAWRERQAALAGIHTWELRGRIAVRTAEDGGPASLHWVRRQDTHRIDLAGPFGGGRVRLTQEAGAAELRDSSGQTHRDSSMQRLLARATGWWLPLEGLNYWVLGLPAPDAPMELRLDAWGRLQTLEQLGWDITFTEYIEHGGYELPRRVFIRRKDDGTSMLEVRLAVEQWNLPGAAAK